MRTAGEVATPEGLGAHDHLCWVYEDAEDFHRRASRFLAEGIEHGLAGVWVGTGSHDELAAKLVGLDVPGLERAGALSILALPPQRPSNGPSDPREQAAFWEEWAQRAAGEGFRGLRAAGDATEWVRTAREQATHLAYEAALDHATLRAPLSVMCAFDRSRLGADVAAAFAEIHPLVSRAAAPFQLFFSGEHDVTLRGEVDLSDARALRRSLELVAPGPVGSADAGLRRASGGRPGRPAGAGAELHVDAHGLNFVDHHGLVELDRFGAERGVTLVLHGSGRTCAREVVDVLHLRHLRVADGATGASPATAPAGRAPGGTGPGSS